MGRTGGSKKTLDIQSAVQYNRIIKGKEVMSMQLVASYIDWFVFAVVIGFGFELGGVLYHIVTRMIKKE